MYEVGLGDSPQRIAKKLSGNPYRYGELLAANPHKALIYRDGVPTFAELGLGEQLCVPLGFLGEAVTFVGDRLKSNQGLHPNQGIQSKNGRVKVVLQQSDGNCVLYGDGNPLWWTGVHPGVDLAVMQNDGNFVLYVGGGRPGAQAVWASDTSGHPGAFLVVQDDGNLVVYSGSTALWSSQTDGFRYYGGPGKNVLKQIEDDASDVASIATTVIAFVPGVGTGVAAALAAGLALAEGQNITDALKAGIVNALPGGAVAAAGFDAALKIASGENIGQAALETARDQLPPLGQKAFDVGVAVATAAKHQQATGPVPTSSPAAMQKAMVTAKAQIASASAATVQKALNPPKMINPPKKVAATAPALNPPKMINPPQTTARYAPYPKKMGAISGPSTGTDVQSPTHTATEVRSPTSTSTEVRSPTSTSTEAYTQGNFTVTVTGGAGSGETTVNIQAPPLNRENVANSKGAPKTAHENVNINAPRPKGPTAQENTSVNAPKAGAVGGPDGRWFYWWIHYQGQTYPYEAYVTDDQAWRYELEMDPSAELHRFAWNGSQWVRDTRSHPDLMASAPLPSDGALGACFDMQTVTWGPAITGMSRDMQKAGLSAVHGTRGRPRAVRGPDGTDYLFSIENGTLTARRAIAAA